MRIIYASILVAGAKGACPAAGVGAPLFYHADSLGAAQIDPSTIYHTMNETIYQNDKRRLTVPSYIVSYIVSCIVRTSFVYRAYNVRISSVHRSYIVRASCV